MKTRTASPLLLIVMSIALPGAGIFGAGCGGGATSLGSNPASLNSQSLDPSRSTNASGGITAPAGATQRAGVFVTGGAPSGYAHAWVTIHKIEVVDTAEKAATIWEDRDGQAIDLGTLKDAVGARYALITSASVPSGRAHTRIRITLGKAALLYAPKATVAETFLLSDSIPRDDEGRPTISYSLKKAHDLGSGNDPIVITFDPKKMALKSGRVTLAAMDGSGSAKQTLASVGRQEPALFTGTVGDIARATSDKTGSETTFTLQQPGGQSIVVEIAAGVPVTDEGATPSSPAAAADKAPTADAKGTKTDAAKKEAAASPAAPAAGIVTGKRARVRGTLSLATKRIVATEILLQTETPIAKEGEAADGTAAVATAAEASVVGEATDVKPESGSFTLEARQVYGLVPSQSTINVVLAKGAVLRSLGGAGTVTQEDLLASLKRPGVQVEAVGAFDPITATLTATRVSLNTSTVAPPLSTGKNEKNGTTVSKPPVVTNPSQL